MYIVVFPDIGDTEIRVKRMCSSFYGDIFEVPKLHKISEEASKTNDELAKARDLHKNSVLQLKSYLYDINLDKED